MMAKPPPPKIEKPSDSPRTVIEWLTRGEKVAIGSTLFITASLLGSFAAVAQAIDFLNDRKGGVLLTALGTTLIATTLIVLFVILPKRGEFTLATKAIALVAATFFGSWVIFYAVYTQLNPPTDSESPPPTITEPRDGIAFATDVDYIDVKGTAPLNIESGSQLRIIVEALDQSSWYPQGRLVPTRDGNWQTEVGIGPSDPNKINRTLEFRVVLAKCSRDAVIRLEKARADPNFNSEGMQPLEMGVEELAAVLVRRLGP